jgi:tetratricopeptide (TPR) repeat protein
MKYWLFLGVWMATAAGVTAQEQQTAKLLQETARTLVQKGDYDNAVVILDRAKQQEPNNVTILKDLCFAAYLKRDFSKAIETGKELVEKPDADAQAFQLLGLAYKAIASYKECGKLYRSALRRFPNSGVIYNEYAETFALENEMEEAIAQWEKGIESDPGYSSNYYNATMYHIRKANWLRAALYGEVFLNLESYSTRTEEIKGQLYTAWSNLLAAGKIQQLTEQKTTTVFEKEVLGILAKASAQQAGPVTIAGILSARTRFAVEWAAVKQQQYPFALFSRQQYLVSQGLFEAYTYWLLAPSVGAAAYQAWQQQHPKESAGYTAFQQSRVFKVPAGEYYFSR